MARASLVLLAMVLLAAASAAPPSQQLRPPRPTQHPNEIMDDMFQFSFVRPMRRTMKAMISSGRAIHHGIIRPMQRGVRRAMERMIQEMPERSDRFRRLPLV